MISHRKLLAVNESTLVKIPLCLTNKKKILIPLVSKRKKKHSLLDVVHLHHNSSTAIFHFTIIKPYIITSEANQQGYK